MVFIALKVYLTISNCSEFSEYTYFKNCIIVEKGGYSGLTNQLVYQTLLYKYLYLYK